MPQIFHPSFNTLSRLSVFGAAIGVVGLLILGYLFMRSSYQTKVNVSIDQPIAFSHAHHSGELGIDCRFCHTTVETSAFANVPPTYTCMTCHSQIWKDSPALVQVRQSLAHNQPIRWRRVHDLPDFVYFDHSIHVKKGVGCATCHGRIDEMPLTYKAEPLTMEWCLDCHRHPEEKLRPPTEAFNMNYHLASSEQNAVGKKIVEQNHVPSAYFLTNCSVCHR